MIVINVMIVVVMIRTIIIIVKVRIIVITIVSIKQFKGHNSKLTEAEMKANAMLMTLKEKEMADAFENLNFPPAKNFMTVREEIEASNVFQFISDMPKGEVVFRLVFLLIGLFVVGLD